MKPLAADDPIAALATPWGESALAVVRLSGPGSLGILDGLFRPAGTGKDGLDLSPGYRLHHGMLCRGPEPIDDVMVAAYRRGRSYTGQESAEIICHGGMAVVDAILQTLYESGFRPAEPGEFTQRAFLNGKMDLSRAEAVNEIIRSRTDRARARALNRLSGGIEEKINELKERFTGLRAAVEVHIDYPDEDLPEGAIEDVEVAALEEELRALLATYRTGRLLQEGASLVIAGRTNAGKSTLFNLLLKEDRAIVSETHGTTRDYIEGAIAIEGIPLRLFDTAGLRESRDRLEVEGMKRSDRIIRNAQLLLYLVDAAAGFREEDRRLMAEYQKNVEVVPVWNKIDAAEGDRPSSFLPLSAATGEGLERLNREVVKRLYGGSRARTDQVVIDSHRQKELIEGCLEALGRFREGLSKRLPLDILGEDLREAQQCLGEITGEVATEAVLRCMFSRFCVGK